jgi:hypothetical protein
LNGEESDGWQMKVEKAIKKFFFILSSKSHNYYFLFRAILASLVCSCCIARAKSVILQGKGTNEAETFRFHEIYKDLF